MDILSVQEKAFVSEYLKTGNGARAAVAAGYAASAARQTAHKILGRQRVKDEVARRANMSPEAMVAEDENGSRGVDQVIHITARSGGGGQPPPLNGEVVPAGADGKPPYDPSRLSRNWIIERLMKTALICMGELPSTETKIVTRTNADGGVTATAVLVQGYGFNPAGVIGSMVQLSKELDRTEATVGARSTDTAQLPNRPQFEEAMKMYRQAGELVRQAHAPKA